MSDETTKIIERLTEKSEISQESREFISEKADSNLQSYHAGEDKGYQRGRTAGFAQGVAATALAGLVAVGGVWLKKK